VTGPEKSVPLVGGASVSRRRFMRGAIAMAATMCAPMMFASEAAARRHAVASKSPPSAAHRAHPANSLNAPYTTACAMENATGTLIFDRDMDRPWPTASLAKMMLMLIVAEKLHDGSLQLTNRVTTSASASKMGGSQVYLKEGEVFTLEQMMQAVVIHSANDASLAVAEYVGGSGEAFTEMMKQRAAALGLKNTHYYSIAGLPPGRGQQPDVSSAYDLAVTARELVKYPDILRWSGTNSGEFRNGAFQLRNTNHLLSTFPGCDGLKTGFYDQAGFNVVATARRNDLRLIAVVLGSPRKNENFAAAATLMAQGFANYEMRPIAHRGDAIARVVPVTDGATSNLRPVWSDNASVFTRRGDAKTGFTVDFRLPASIAAPVAAGQRVGTAVIVVDGKSRQEIPLLAPAGIDRGNLFQRFTGAL
jgi:serine-type D-Ala-D-Ala carboxypeptidase (penicillin-binding protein 5/6)